MDGLISSCYVRQCSQRQPGVCFLLVWALYELLFHILLHTDFLHASSTWHRTPTDSSHTQGRVEVFEPLSNQCPCLSNSYNIWGNTKFASPMYKHTPNAAILSPYCTTKMSSSCEASRILQNSGTFFYVVYTQHLVAKPSTASWILECLLNKLAGYITIMAKHRHS